MLPASQSLSPLLQDTDSRILVLQPVHVQVVRRLWEACHYTVMRRRCQAAGLQQMAAKQATSLLRYIGDVPADKAFYEAGGVPDCVRLLVGVERTSGSQCGSWRTQHPACGVVWVLQASSSRGAASLPGHRQQVAPLLATADAQRRLPRSAEQLPADQL